MESKEKAPLAEGVNATPYEGTYVVVNGTGTSISNVTVTHTCSNFKDTVVAEKLSPGQATAAQILHAQTGSNDYWTISFQMGGQSLSRTEKQCNYVQSDSPSTCIIALYASNFSVITPASAPCLNNSYS